MSNENSNDAKVTIAAEDPMDVLVNGVPVRVSKGDQISLGQNSINAAALKKWIESRGAICQLSVSAGSVSCAINPYGWSDKVTSNSTDLPEAIRGAQHLFDAETASGRLPLPLPADQPALPAAERLEQLERRVSLIVDWISLPAASVAERAVVLLELLQLEEHG